MAVLIKAKINICTSIRKSKSRSQVRVEIGWHQSFRLVCFQIWWLWREHLRVRSWKFGLWSHC